MTRQRVVELLQDYLEARDPLMGPAGSPGDGSGVPSMNPLWDGEMRELDRRLQLLKADHPLDYAHLRERYLACNPFNEVVKRVRVNANGKPKPPYGTEILVEYTETKQNRSVKCRLRRWQPWVSKQRVEAAVEYLASVPVPQRLPIAA